MSDTKKPKAVIVHSFPRSGTHLTIDFIRRNLVDFSRQLHFWESSSKLYLDLDVRLLGIEPNDIPPCFSGRHLVAKSHWMDFPYLLRSQVEALLKDFDIYEVYPFRKFSQTTMSFARYSRYDGPVLNFLEEPDSHFGSGLTIKEAMHKHAGHALSGPAAFLNVDWLIANPEAAARALGRHTASELAPIKRRLPRQKVFLGSVSELAERLWKNRESTEVKIGYPKSWADVDEPGRVDTQFSDLYHTLVKRQLGSGDD